jgi:hypothetical protein
MSPYDQEFEELQKLVDRKLSDFRYWYKIDKQGTLSVYDIFNSQKVDDYLEREGGCKKLVPCEVDETLLTKRFGIAFQVSQDRKAQNEDPVFCAKAQKILNKAKEILQDRQKERAYSAWFLATLHTGADKNTGQIEAEKARREAEEEKRKRREAEERLAEAERARREAEEKAHREAQEKVRREAEDKAHREAQEKARREAEEKRRREVKKNPAGCLIWLALAIGLLLQLCHTTSNHDLPVPPPGPTSTPGQTPELTPTPLPTPVPTPVPTPLPVPVPKPDPQHEIATLVFAYMDATQNGKPITLTPYCTSKLGIWYGRKGLTIREAEADISAYYRIWPRQNSWFNQTDLQILPWKYDNTYFIKLPFQFSAENNEKRASGKSILKAVIVLKNEGYRIYSAWNDKT